VEFAFLLLQGLFLLSSNPMPDFIAYVHQLFIALFVFFLSMKGYEQLFPEKINDKAADISTDTNDKQALSSLEIKRWSEKIRYLFEEQKLYHNPDLNIEMLSKELALSVRLTSYILNHGLEQNFTQLLNSYRTAEVVSRLSNGEHKKVTILSIAFDAGFESKSTFYRNFKSLTGLTPSEYISRLEYPNKRPS
jgi:AraC-like DNA-binding protein